MPPETLPTSHTVDDVQFAICNLQSAICNLQFHGNPQSTFAFLTAYVPEELFHAAGFTPVFIFHTSDDEGHARAHLPLPDDPQHFARQFKSISKGQF